MSLPYETRNSLTYGHLESLYQMNGYGKDLITFAFKLCDQAKFRCKTFKLRSAKLFTHNQTQENPHLDLRSNPHTSICNKSRHLSTADQNLQWTSWWVLDMWWFHYILSKMNLTNLFTNLFSFTFSFKISIDLNRLQIIHSRWLLMNLILNLLPFRALYSAIHSIQTTIWFR